MHGTPPFTSRPGSRNPPHCTVTPGCAPSDPTLRAHLARSRLLRSGLLLHWEDAHEPSDLVVHSEIDAGLRIVLLLEGAIDVSYGPQRVSLSSERGCAQAALVALARPERLTRRAHCGVYSRRVNLSLSPCWLDQADTPSKAVDHFMRRHLALQRWSVSPRAAAIAEQIVHPPRLEPLLLSIYLESRVLQLVGEALTTLGPANENPAPSGSIALRPREHQRIRELHAWLASGQADGLGLDEIARRVGVNTNTLQRQFRAIFGTTIIDHLRECRLLRARQALEHDGATVGQAATLAGYTSPANFATAFRRRFGFAPKMARARV